MMAEKLSASIRLRLKSDIEQRTQEIVARIRELEAVVKEGGSSGEQAARQQALEFKRLARAVRDGERAERDMAKAERVLGGASAQLTAQTQGLESATRQSTAAVAQGAQTWTGFVKANMAAEMKRTGSHAAAMTSIGKMWKEEKKLTTATRGATAAIKAESVALNTVGKSAKKSAGGLRLVSKASQNTGRQIGGLVNVFAESAYSLATAIPAFRQAGTQMAMMGGNAYQLGSSMGPMGVALGVTIGLLPTLIDLYGSLTSETDDATAATERSNQAHRTHLDLIDEEVQKQRQRQRQADLLRGARDLEEQRAAVNVAIRDERQVRESGNDTQMHTILGSNFGQVAEIKRAWLVQQSRRRHGVLQQQDFEHAGLNRSDALAAVQHQHVWRSSGFAPRVAVEQRNRAAAAATQQARAAERAVSARQAAEERTKLLEDQRRRLEQAQRRQIATLPPRQQSRASRLLRSGRLFSSTRNVNRVFGVGAGTADETNFQLQRVSTLINAQKDSELGPLLRDVADSNARVAAALEADRQIHVTVDPAAGTGGVAPDNSSRLGGAE